MKLTSILSKLFKFNNSDENGGKKGNIAVFLLLGGIFLIAFSGLFSFENKPEETENSTQIFDVRTTEEKRLEKILAKVSGVKSVTVLISYNNNGTTEALTEEKTVLKNSKSLNEINNVETQTEKKPVFDGNKNIVAKTQYMPEVKGVCIFYSGSKDEETENKLYRAVKGALGVELHKVEVIHTTN